MQHTTVMIIDGHPVLCDGLSAQLSEHADISVVGSANSLDNLASLIETIRPSVIIIDFDIAQADPAQHLKNLYRDPDAPAIVLLAGECEPEAAMKALRAGASAVVLRDCPLQDLATAIRWARRDEMWVAPALLSELLGNVQRDASSADAHQRLSQLSAREVEVLRLLVEGVGLPEMAEQLDIALNTVRTHTRNIHLKLRVHSNVAAVSLALEKEMSR